MIDFLLRTHRTVLELMLWVAAIASLFGGGLLSLTYDPEETAAAFILGALAGAIVFVFTAATTILPLLVLLDVRDTLKKLEKLARQ